MDLPVYGLDPVTLNAGLRKPRRGFTLVTGEEKLGVGKGAVVIPPLFHSLSVL